MGCKAWDPRADAGTLISPMGVIEVAHAIEPGRPTQYFLPRRWAWRVTL